MNFDRIPLARRRFLVLGCATALAAACSESSSTDATTASTTTRSTTGSTSAPTTGSTATSVTDSTTGSAVGTPTESTTESTVGPDALTPFTAADFESLGVCALMAETTAGPYPTQEQLDRRDVTEGYPGHPTRLGLRVVDATCNPVPGAVVEIWHTDATGDYSEYSDGGDGKDEGGGTTFLRGYQASGDDGIVEFHTVYPGWYPGRAVHIHLSVHIDGETVLTSQLFFDDEYTDQIYAEAPYAEFGGPDTPNDRDNIAGPAIATGGLLTVTAGPTAGGQGTVALTNLGASA